VLTILDQVLQRFMRMRPYRLISPLDPADATRLAISALVMVAAVRISLATSDLLPQLADLNRLPDIPAHHVAIEEVGSMDVVAPSVITIPLLYCADISSEVLESRMTTVLGNQGIQIIKYLLDS